MNFFFISMHVLTSWSKERKLLILEEAQPTRDLSDNDQSLTLDLSISSGHSSYPFPKVILGKSSGLVMWIPISILRTITNHHHFFLTSSLLFPSNHQQLSEIFKSGKKNHTYVCLNCIRKSFGHKWNNYVMSDWNFLESKSVLKHHTKPLWILIIISWLWSDPDYE